MQIDTAKAIVPSKGMVIVEIQLEDTNDVVLTAEIDNNDVSDLTLYKGKVLKYAAGSKKNSEAIKNGKLALFTEFSGYHIPVKDKLVKIINSYDILAYTDTMDITINGLTPSNDRLLISEYVEDTGVILDSSVNKRSVALKFGKVEKIGAGCSTEINVGDIVAYEKYSGEVVNKDNGNGVPELTIILKGLILFTIRK